MWSSRKSELQWQRADQWLQEPAPGEGDEEKFGGGRIVLHHDYDGDTFIKTHLIVHLKLVHFIV